MKNMLDIPEHWKVISLVEDMNYVPTGVEAYLGKKRYYSTGSIKDKEQTPEGEYTFEKRPSRANRMVFKNDVLQARMKGTNKALLIDDNLDGSLFSTGFFQVRPYGDTYNPKLLYYYLSSNVFLKEKDELCSGSTQSALNDTNAKKIKIPLPPIEEQNRIVNKIESLLSELDSSIENLQRAKKKLKFYRQSVLKSAFEGRLTEVWRQAHAYELENAEVLLERIKQEREAAYEESLTEWEVSVKAWEEGGKVGKKPAKPRKPKKLPPLSQEELAALPGISEVYTYTRLGNIAHIVGGVTKGRKLDGRKLIKLPYLRVANVQDGYLDLKEIKYIDVLYEDLKKYRLEKGDILYTEGGDKDKLGRGTVWNNEVKDCIHQNHIFRARLINKNFNSKFYAYYSQSKTAKKYFFSNAKQTVNLASINMTVLSSLPVIIVDEKEQDQIVRKIESHFSVVNKMDDAIEVSLKKAESLRQSILKSAFEGRLVENKEGTFT